MLVAHKGATQYARRVTFGDCFGLATFVAVFGVTLVLLGAAFLFGWQFVPQGCRSSTSIQLIRSLPSLRATLRQSSLSGGHLLAQHIDYQRQQAEQD